MKKEKEAFLKLVRAKNYYNGLTMPFSLIRNPRAWEVFELKKTRARIDVKRFNEDVIRLREEVKDAETAVNLNKKAENILQNDIELKKDILAKLEREEQELKEQHIWIYSRLKFTI